MRTRQFYETMEKEADNVRVMVTEILLKYPDATTTMLAVRLRPYVGRLWRTFVDDMVANGEVIAIEKHNGERGRPSICYRLAPPESAPTAARQLMAVNAVNASAN